MLREWRMQQNGSKYFACRRILTSRMVSKVQNIFFLKVAMLHIKLKGMELRLSKYLIGYIERTSFPHLTFIQGRQLTMAARGSNHS